MRVPNIKAQLAALQKRAQDVMTGIEARASKEATEEENVQLREIRASILLKMEELREAEELQKVLTVEAETVVPAPKAADAVNAEARGVNPAAAPVILNSAGRPVHVEFTRTALYRGVGEQLQDIYACTPGTNKHNDVRNREQAANRLAEAEKRAGASGLSTLNGPDGGFALAPEYSTEIVRQQFEVGQLASRCKKVPMASDRLITIALDDSSRADGQRLGGVTAKWVNEAEASTDSKPKLRKVEMQANKLMASGRATSELLSDAPALGAIMLDAFIQEFAFQIDEAIIYGTGTDMPLGILDSKYKGTVTVSKESGQAAPVYTLVQNIAKMIARMPANCRKDAFFAINPELRPYLDTMTLAVGTGGVPVFMPANNIAGPGYDTLYGLPILALEQCAAAGTLGDFMLLSLGQSYMLGSKGGVQTDSSMHVYFSTDEMAFRCIQRIGGQPIPHAPITPKRTALSFKLSPFILLEAR